MDPYSMGLFNQTPFGRKRFITSSIVAILKVKAEKRGLHLIYPKSRALIKNEIHELIVTDERDAKPGKVVNKVAYLAFIEISTGGVVVVGDNIYWNDKLLGVVAGFDDTHMPNHQNILLYSNCRMTGEELGIEVDDIIVIQANNINKTIN